MQRAVEHLKNALPVAWQNDDDDDNDYADFHAVNKYT